MTNTITTTTTTSTISSAAINRVYELTTLQLGQQLRGLKHGRLFKFAVGCDYPEIPFAEWHPASLTGWYEARFVELAGQKFCVIVGELEGVIGTVTLEGLSLRTAQGRPSTYNGDFVYDVEELFDSLGIYHVYVDGDPDRNDLNA